jgi:hypothetical protein
MRTTGAEWFPIVYLGQEQIGILKATLTLEVNSVAQLDLEGYAPQSFDTLDAMKHAGVVTLSLTYSDGETVFYTAHLEEQ